MEKHLIVTCPYNKAHRIRRYKLMSHIVKCKKQYGTTNKIACPLNSSHIIDPNDIRDHLSSCSNLSSLIQNDIEKKPDIVPIMDADTHQSFENWDEIPEVPTYDAMANAASRKVIRCMSGLTKSERLKYRLSERERIAKLNEISPTTEQIRPSHTKTIHEIVVRPPSDIPQAENNENGKTQQKSNENAQKQNFDAGSSKLKTTNEYRDIFQKTLYNELLSNCEPDDNWRDNTFIVNENQYVKSEDCVKTSNTLQKLLEHSMASNDTSYKSFNYSSSSLDPFARSQFEMLSKKDSKKENGLLFTDQSQKVKDKKKKDVVEVDTFCVDIFGANTSKRETERTEDTGNANTSNEQRVTNKLLNLLISKTEKIELAEKKKENDEKYMYDRNLKWENLLHKFSDQLDHLTNAQSVAAEQSARLAKEVSDLKQKSCCNSQSSAMLSNSHCAANFTEPITLLKPSCSKYSNVSEEAHNMSFENTLSSYNDNSEIPKLKTPKDFDLY